MAVSQKHRRKLLHKGVFYLWYIKLDDDFYEQKILHILSEDKGLLVDCPLDALRPYIVSKGRIFQGKKTNGRYNRYFLPFQILVSITPGFICRLISFAAEKGSAERAEFDENGFWY